MVEGLDSCGEPHGGVLDEIFWLLMSPWPVVSTVNRDIIDVNWKIVRSFFKHREDSLLPINIFFEETCEHMLRNKTVASDCGLLEQVMLIILILLKDGVAIEDEGDGKEEMDDENDDEGHQEEY